jgi:seryl-tRNA synthetase
MNIKFRPRNGGKPEIVHTLNGSGLALPRVVAALIEHYQTPEGKIIIPKILHPYTKFEVIG